MHIRDGNNTVHICDGCNKPIKKWEVQSLVKRWQTPGPLFHKFSSDINAHNQKIAEYCPDCMNEIIAVLTAEKESED